MGDLCQLAGGTLQATKVIRGCGSTSRFAPASPSPWNRTGFGSALSETPSGPVFVARRGSRISPQLCPERGRAMDLLGKKNEKR